MINNYAWMMTAALLLGPPLATADPQLHYSDLDSAPPGAWVTVWGSQLGASAGRVHVGDAATAAADIVSWSDDKVEFRLPPGAGEGLRVESSAGAISNKLGFVTREQGRIYFIAAEDGNDANDGLAATAQGHGQGPWRTLPRLLESVRPGDVVYLRAGEYLDVGDAQWRTYLLIRDRYAGRPGLPIALVAYPGERPVVGQRGAGALDRGIYFHHNISDWTVAKLELRAGSTALGFSQKGSPARIRIVGNSASGIASPYGTIRFSACSDCKVLGNHVHDSGRRGSKLSHLIYYGGFGAASNVEIAWNHLHDQRGGRCIQVYGHTDDDRLSGLSIHDNRIYNCPYDCILVGGSDARTKNWIKDAAIYGNLTYNCGQAGIRLANPGVDATISGNTIFNARHTLRVDDAGDVVVHGNLFGASADATPSFALRRFKSLRMQENGYTGSGPIPAQERDAIRGKSQLDQMQLELRWKPPEPLAGR